MKRYGIGLALALVLLSTVVNYAMVDDSPMEYDFIFVRKTGKPVTEIRTFDGFDDGQALITLTNGGGDSGKISSANVKVNGKAVFGPSNFNQNVSQLQATVEVVEGKNTLEVVLNSKPGGKLTINITVHKTPPPLKIAITNPVENSVISDSSPDITIGFGIPIPDLNLENLIIKIDNVDETANFAIENNCATPKAPYDLAPGGHEIAVFASDKLGNSDQLSCHFRVEPSSNPMLYLFSLKDNPWTFASPGDGTYSEYMSLEDIGIPIGSDLISLSMPILNQGIFYSLSSQGGIYHTYGDGASELHLVNAQLGLSDAERLNALNVGFEGDPVLFSLLGDSGIYQSMATGSFQAYLASSQIGLSPDSMIDSLDRGYDNTLYFQIEGQSGIYRIENGGNTLFITEGDLGVPGSTLDAFSLMPEQNIPSIIITNPLDQAILNTNAPAISITYTDTESGIDTSSFHARIDGTDVTAFFTVSADKATGQIPESSPLSEDLHSLNVSIKDKAGNQGTATADFTVSLEPPAISISATPSAIPAGESTTLSWTSTNATSVSINNGIGRVDLAGSLSVSPLMTATYTFTVTGPSGSITQAVLVTVNDPPVVEISCEPSGMPAGGTALLSWSVANAETVTIDQGIGAVLPTGSISVSPATTTTYTLTATGPGGTRSASATVSVTLPPPDPPAVTISAAPDTVSPGASSALTWSATNADTVTIDQGVGDVAPNGSMNITPGQTTTYTITAQGAGGTATASTTVTVSAAQGPPIIDFFTAASGQTPILQGTSTTLNWKCANAAGVATVHIEPVGEVAIDAATLNVTPNATTTYTLMVSNPWGSANAQVTVHVTVPREPLPEGSFGEKYEDLIPADTTLAEYNAEHFSITTGLVFDASNNPLAGVSVTVLEHPRYGTAATDDEGRFSLPVDVGNHITLVYRKSGYLDVQRQVNVTWNDISPAESVVMLQQDPVATTITLDGNPESSFSHESSESNDIDGKRAATVVFKGDTVAYAVDAAGNTIQALPNTFTVRATEYTVGDNGRAAMPAALPPQVAYTYCVELQVDGVDRVKFSKPVILWVDNFIGFDVGGAAPVGIYDRDKGVWVPQRNGAVVGLLDTNGDGTADALDATGSGQPTDLNGDGSFSDEIDGLDVVKYKPGVSLWRVEVAHFSPCDINYPPTFPADAKSPNGGNPSTDGGKKDGKDCNTQSGSYLNDRSRILHQDIPVPGTDIALHYSSERTPGFKYNITLPVSGAEVPASLKAIVAKITVAGRTFEQIFNAAPLTNKVMEIQWDGLDYLGRAVDLVKVQCDVGFVYPTATYGTPAGAIQSFGLAPGVSTSFRLRSGPRIGFALDSVVWKRYVLAFTIPTTSRYIRTNTLLADGWTITNHHRVVLPTLYRGDGTSNDNAGNIITTVAGNGTVGYSGDEGLATEATIRRPTGVAVDSSGNIYIADYYDHRVRKVDTNGIITTVAGIGGYGSGGYGGGGSGGYSGDGGPATEARLNNPSNVALDAAGNLYIVDQSSCRIRKVDTSGIITTIAGNGSAHSVFSGDGGPATQASMNIAIFGIALDAAGNLYIADRYNNRIRKVDTNGIITTVAGNGQLMYSGDGVPATQTSIGNPHSVFVDTAGNLYISDSYNRRILKVNTSGIITTVAGNGPWSNSGQGYNGDGGPATEAMLWYPRGVVVDTAGNIYIADEPAYCIRKVNTDGIITTVAGNGNAIYSGDGGAATLAGVSPFGIDIDASGNLYIADTNSRIRKIHANMHGLDIANVNVIPDNNGQGYIMDSAGRHTKTIDLATGATIYDFEYEPYGEDIKLSRIKDRFGRYTTIQRDGTGTPTAIVSPDGITTALAIDQDNHLTEITHPDNTRHTFTYASDGLMLSKTEPKGNHFEYLYDTAGKLTDVYDHQSGERYGHWHLYRRAIHEEDPELNDGFSAGDIVYRVSTGEGNSTTYIDKTSSTAYTSEITGPAGDKTNYSSTLGDLHVEKSLSCGKNLVIDYKLDSEFLTKYVGKLIERFPSGLSREKTANRIYEETDSNHPDFDRTLEVTSVNGKSTSLVTDIVSNTVTATTPMNRAISLRYDPVSLLPVDVQKPGQNPIAFSYDTQGRPTEIRSGDRILRMEYDDTILSDRTITATVMDAASVPYLVTVYHFDIMDRLWKVEQKDKDEESIVLQNTDYSYDQNGNLRVLTKQDQNGNKVEHIFAFNDVNLASLYQTPQSGNYQYIYNKDRALVKIVSPSGTRDIENTYQKTLLTTIETAEGPIDLTYECSSKVKNMTRGEGAEQTTLTYGYDGTLITSEQSGGVLGQTIGYSYNNDFNLSSISYAGGGINLTYDNDGLLTSTGRFTVNRDAETGLPDSVTSAELDMDLGFNAYGQIQDQSVTVNGIAGYAWDLTHDNAGRIKTRTDNIGGTATNVEYIYDDVGRLASVLENGVMTERYTYYPNGARATEMNLHKGITAPRGYQYTREDQLTTAGNIGYTYDADGFVRTKTVAGDTTTYTYSSLGELTEVALPDGNIINYIYDPNGRRIARKYNGVVTHKYLWLGQTTLLAVYDGSDNLLMRFEYAAGRMPMAMTMGGATYYLAYDQVGSLRLVTDAGGNTVKRIDFDAFGAIFNDTNPAFEVPFGFAGGLYDQKTGLVRFGFRDYDAESGRWTAKDPILFAGGDTDLYGYVLNDAINSFDNIGLLDSNYDVFGSNTTSTYFPPQNSMELDHGACIIRAPYRHETDDGEIWPPYWHETDEGQRYYERQANAIGALASSVYIPWNLLSAHSGMVPFKSGGMGLPKPPGARYPVGREKH